MPSCSGRRAVARREALGRLPSGVLPAGPGAVAGVPAAVPGQAAVAFEVGQLGFFGHLAGLAEPAAFTRRLRKLRRIEWVVCAKPPFGGPAQVLAHLGRYTHRVEIANSRLAAVTDHESPHDGGITAIMARPRS